MNEQWIWDFKWCSDMPGTECQGFEIPFFWAGQIPASSLELGCAGQWGAFRNQTNSLSDSLCNFRASHLTPSGCFCHLLPGGWWCKIKKFQWKIILLKRTREEPEAHTFHVSDSWVVLSKVPMSDSQGGCRSHKLLQLEWIINLK